MEICFQRIEDWFCRGAIVGCCLDDLIGLCACVNKSPVSLSSTPSIEEYWRLLSSVCTCGCGSEYDDVDTTYRRVYVVIYSRKIIRTQSSLVI